MQAIDQNLFKLKDLEQPVPVDAESPFKIRELFFSITDPKSHIQFANDVFIRISKYEQEEIIGQLHKVIRHPDMPRSVFHVFWEYLLANKPVAAYVKNMAKDGSYYWVMALAFPCKGGYLSIRLKPSSPLFHKVKDIYASTLAHEKEAEKLTGKRKAMLSGKESLLTSLQKEGFADYQEFMWNALQAEMSHREQQIQSLMVTSRKEVDVPPALLELETVLSELVLSLEKLKTLHGGLMSHSDYILNLARSILLLSLNAQIGSAKLDGEDLSLSVVAEKMGEQSVDGEEKLIRMKRSIQEFSELIGTLNFDIISSKLQVEMTIDFIKELRSKKNHEFYSFITPDETQELLFDAFLPNMDRIVTGLGKVSGSMQDLLSGVKTIERFLMVLRFIHITGKVEVARMNDSQNSFSTTFQELVTEIETAESHLTELENVVLENKDTVSIYLKLQQRIKKLSEELNFNR
tara:strand:- start:47882 stop:49267 length:1386 start_codon:yes stop_codon:yes gene_type:complete